MEPSHAVPGTVNTHNSLFEQLAKRAAAAVADATRRPQRRYTTVAHLSLVLVLLSAGLGIALSAVIICLKLQTKGDTASRMLLLVASCMSVVHTGLHVAAATKTYARNYHSTSWAYGEYIFGTALLLSRLTILVWIAATIATAVVSAKKGIHTSKGLGANVAWLALLVSVLALLLSVGVQFAIEASDQPFATADASRQSFVQGRARSSMSGLLRSPVEVLNDTVLEAMEKRVVEPRKQKRLSKLKERSRPSTNLASITPSQGDTSAAEAHSSAIENPSRVKLPSLQELEEPARAHAHARSNSQPVSTSLCLHPPVPPLPISRRWSALPSPMLSRAAVASSRRGSASTGALDAAAADDDIHSLIVKRVSYASTASSYDSFPSRRATVEMRASGLSFARWPAYGVAGIADATFAYLPKPIVQPRTAPWPPSAGAGPGPHRPDRRRGDLAPLMTSFSRPRTSSVSSTPVSGSGGGPKGWPLTPQMWGRQFEDAESPGGGKLPPGGRAGEEELSQLEAEMGTLGVFPRPPGSGIRDTFGMEKGP